MSRNGREGMLKNGVQNYLKALDPEAESVIIDPSKLIFEENVKMNCFYCGKYNHNWRCPPNLPNIDYKKMLSEYDTGLIVILSFNIKKKSDYARIRNDSSVTLHKLLLELEKWMYDQNRPNALSFIGGSCKLCKGGCGKERCNNPYMSRTPIEALGINIIKSVKEYDIEIKFPADKVLKRIGLLLWQEV